MKTKIIFLLLASCFMILNSSSSSLAQTPIPKGVTVFPSIAHIDLAIDPSEYDLTYVNNTNYDIEIKLSSKDFTDLEYGHRINYLEEKDAANYQYSLSSWLSFENNTLQLSPQEKKSVKIFIDKERITKGGHYASILAEIVTPNSEKQVDVKGILSSLLFVRASTGQELESGKINGFFANRSRLGFPKDFTLRFENNGNVFVTPYGLVEIFNSNGKLVAKGILNEDSGETLPESIRNYTIPVKKLDTNILIPGKYTAKLSMHFGKTNQKLSSEVKFYSQGSFDILKITLILISGIMLFILFKRKLRKKKEVKNEDKFLSPKVTFKVKKPSRTRTRKQIK